MSDVPAVNSLARDAGMDDRTILAVLNPPPNERNARQGRVGNPHMPPNEAWRNDISVGAQLIPNRHKVVSNFFPVDTSAIISTIYLYSVQIFKYLSSTSEFETTDCAGSEDNLVLMELMTNLKEKHPEWSAPGLQVVYDGRSLAYASKRIPFPPPTEEFKETKPTHYEVVALKDVMGADSSKKYRVKIQEVSVIHPQNWNFLDEVSTNALETCLMCFAQEGEWLKVGAKAYRSTGEQMALNDTQMLCMRGYYAGFKATISGLHVVSDMSVSAFLRGGDLVDLMAGIGGYRDVAEMYRDCGSRGLDPRFLKAITDQLKNSKIKLKHLGHTKKFRSFGKASNDPSGKFDCDGKKVTVADYFEEMCKKPTGNKYRKVLPGGKLKYPNMPTVNLGTTSHPVLVRCRRACFDSCIKVCEPCILSLYPLFFCRFLLRWCTSHLVNAGAGRLRVI